MSFNNHSHLRPNIPTYSQHSDDEEQYTDHNSPLTGNPYFQNSAPSRSFNNSTTSLNFQHPVPPPTYDTSSHSIIDDYYNRPIFDTNSRLTAQENPFHENYEMEYTGQGYNNNYNQAFVPNVYDDEEREFDQHIQY
ncbi:uncharacterized protein SPAPADRAFT_59173, partial [Spathaspora passalidarum NRRL Y-27907]